MKKDWRWPNAYAISQDTKLGTMYWGPGPLPQGATLVGVVTRLDGTTTGALIQMPTGNLMQGNAGCLTSLPPQIQKKISIER
ncbi:MAG: hypothetical protein DDT34_02115 [Firmicutes bacterium]|nr:hypothetical protein [Bacillota bacterium]